MFISHKKWDTNTAGKENKRLELNPFNKNFNEPVYQLTQLCQSDVGGHCCPSPRFLSRKYICGYLSLTITVCGQNILKLIIPYNLIMSSLAIL